MSTTPAGRVLTAADRARLADAFELVALVEESWPSAKFTDDHRRRYAADVAHLDRAEATAAVEVLKRSGREFPPPAGDVCREVARLQVDAPDWGEVKRQLVKRWEATVVFRDKGDDWTCPAGRCDGSGFVHHDERNDATDCECRPAMIAARRKAGALHPLLREFVEAGYVTWDEIETVGRGGATTLEAQMRVKWEAFARQAVESRALASIDGPPTLRRLERARSENAPRQRRDLDLVDIIAMKNINDGDTVRQLTK